MKQITKPIANKTILAIKPYKVGDSATNSRAKNLPKNRQKNLQKNTQKILQKKIVKLSANETPLGTPKSAKQAFLTIAKNLHEYPNSHCTPLRQAIAKIHKLDESLIICGAGSDELLSLLAQAYLTKGDEAIYSKYGFLMYKINILANGAKPIIAAEKNFCADVDNILAKVSKKTKMIFLANPNNPTGTYLPASEIKRLHKNLPSNIILVLDCAYGEYMTEKNYTSGFELVKKNNNIVVTRTFSKIYGLASMRVGWAYAPKNIIDILHRIRGPFNVNSAAIVCATAAIKDKTHIKAAIKHNEKWRGWLSQELTKLGLAIIPSYGNFITIDFGRYNARKADEFLRNNGYILRPLTAYGFNNALRLTIGTKHANETVVKLLKEFLYG